MRKVDSSYSGKLNNFFGKHHTEEAKRLMSIAKKGKKLSDEHKEKLRIASIRAGCKLPSLLGTKWTPEHKANYVIARTGLHIKPLSLETKENLSRFWKGKRLGSSNPAWKGGKTALSDQIRCSTQSTEWRKSVFARDCFTCQKCGQVSGYLEAHHIKPLSLLIRIHHIKTFQQALQHKELWDIKNGKTLCKKCHNVTKFGKPTTKGLVYVAGAYSSTDTLTVFDNIRKGMRVSAELLLHKFSPFCPFLDFHFILMLQPGEKLSVQSFYDYSIEWLKVSDVMVVLPGWESSKGTLKEIEIANKSRIPIYSYEEFKKIWTRRPF